MGGRAYNGSQHIIHSVPLYRIVRCPWEIVLHVRTPQLDIHESLPHSGSLLIAERSLRKELPTVCALVAITPFHIDHKVDFIF